VSRRGLALVVSLQFAALLVVCLLIGDNGWDDGAITLAFARTFAQSGRIALTPHSEIVEGFSSVSWFLLNALPALARPSWHASLLLAQVLSALCICACTCLLARTCALLRLDRLFSTLTLVTFAAWGCSFYEAANGMEMGLAAAAMLVMVNELLRPHPRLLLLGAGAVLAVTTRFEAVLYVGLLALSVVSAPKRRAFFSILAATLICVLLLSAWRLATFSDVLPNTYWAKRWPPYAEFGLSDRLVAAGELPGFFLVPLLALGVLARRGLALSAVLRAHRHACLVLAAPILGAILMGALTGKHMGYVGRMPYFGFPLLLLLLSPLLSSWVNARPSRRRVALAAGLFLASLGTSMRGFPTGPLGAAWHGGTFGVSPHTYAETGQVFRRFAAAADLAHATVLSPDLGGLALCCEEFRIVDLALLSNRRLARAGHAALAELLAAESPELIEAHWRWAAAGGLYELPTFRAHYLPAFAGGTKLWLRRDVATAIEGKGRGCRLAIDRAGLQQLLSTHRYADHDLPTDREAFARPGVVVVLQADSATGGLCPHPPPPDQGGPSPGLGK
jgi:hypothetical protein